MEQAHESERIYGLDMGIASIGWAVIDEKSKRVLKAGARTFEAPEEDKTKVSKMKIRGQKIRLRRTLRRRVFRKQKLRELFIRHGFEIEGFETIAKGRKHYSVWQIRAEGLDRRLSELEFFAALFHIAAHRGYQENRREAVQATSEDQQETGKIKKALQSMQEAMQESSARTIGQYMATLPIQRNRKEYERMVLRDWLRDEAAQLFEVQRSMGLTKASKELEAEYNTWAFEQLPLKSTAERRGFCSFYPKEYRAPKFSPSAEWFVFLSRLNNLKITNQYGAQWPLTPEVRQTILQSVAGRKETSFEQLRRDLELDDSYRFNLVNYYPRKKANSREKPLAVEGSTLFCKRHGHFALQQALGKDRFAWPELDRIAEVISFCYDPPEIRKELQELRLNLAEAEIASLLKITSFKQTIDLSLKAVRQLLPHLKEGLRYDEACASAGLNHALPQAKEGSGRLPPFPDQLNPYVNRALAQTRKLVNALIREYGMPAVIRIELAREVGQSAERRIEMTNQIEENRKANDKRKKDYQSLFGKEIGGKKELIKFRLWQEQKGRCAYSGNTISVEDFLDSSKTQVDHILPLSRSFDDSLGNKVICLTAENQNKGNQTPFEAFGQDEEKWRRIEAFAATLPARSRKKENLLKKNFKEVEGEFTSRALNDTRFITRKFAELLRGALMNSTGREVKIECVNGQITSQLRQCWGLVKNREDHRHHALDAMVIAMTSVRHVQQVTRWIQNRHYYKHQEIEMPKPWPTFSEEARQMYEGIFVSQAPTYRVRGAWHNETLLKHTPPKHAPTLPRQPEYPFQSSQQEVIKEKKLLKDLTVEDIENLYNRERQPKIYQLLKDRLARHGNNAEKAFKDPLYLESAHGKTAPEIRSVTVALKKPKKPTVFQFSDGRIIGNLDHARVDVFRKGEKFYLVPLRRMHLLMKQLPNRAITAGKPETQWDLVDESFVFLFSLYHKDLIRVQLKKWPEPLFFYYLSVHIGTAAITCVPHNLPIKDGSQSIGSKTLAVFEKWKVDHLGNKTQVNQEQRVTGRRHKWDGEP